MAPSPAVSTEHFQQAAHSRLLMEFPHVEEIVLEALSRTIDFRRNLKLEGIICISMDDQDNLGLVKLHHVYRRGDRVTDTTQQSPPTTGEDFATREEMAGKPSESHPNAADPKAESNAQSEKQMDSSTSQWNALKADNPTSRMDSSQPEPQFTKKSCVPQKTSDPARQHTVANTILQPPTCLAQVQSADQSAPQTPSRAAPGPSESVAPKSEGSKPKPSPKRTPTGRKRGRPSNMSLRLRALNDAQSPQVTGSSTTPIIAPATPVHAGTTHSLTPVAPSTPVEHDMQVQAQLGKFREALLAGATLPVPGPPLGALYACSPLVQSPVAENTSNTQAVFPCMPQQMRIDGMSPIVTTGAAQPAANGAYIGDLLQQLRAPGVFSAAALSLQQANSIGQLNPVMVKAEHGLPTAPLFSPARPQIRPISTCMQNPLTPPIAPATATTVVSSDCASLMPGQIDAISQLPLANQQSMNSPPVLIKYTSCDSPPVAAPKQGYAVAHSPPRPLISVPSVAPAQSSSMDHSAVSMLSTQPSVASTNSTSEPTPQKSSVLLMHVASTAQEMPASTEPLTTSLAASTTIPSGTSSVSPSSSSLNLSQPTSAHQQTATDAQSWSTIQQAAWNAKRLEEALSGTSTDPAQLNLTLLAATADLLRSYAVRVPHRVLPPPAAAPTQAATVPNASGDSPLRTGLAADSLERVNPVVRTASEPGASTSSSTMKTKPSSEASSSAMETVESHGHAYTKPAEGDTKSDTVEQVVVEDGPVPIPGDTDDLLIGHFAYICRYCAKVFTRKSSHWRHERYSCKNTDQTRFICDGCGSLTTTPYELRSHKKFHCKKRLHNNSARCTACGTIVSTPYYLRKHERYYCPARIPVVSAAGPSASAQTSTKQSSSTAGIARPLKPGNATTDSSLSKGAIDTLGSLGDQYMAPVQ